jgi:hypothetical protein
VVDKPDGDCGEYEKLSGPCLLDQSLVSSEAKEQIILLCGMGVGNNIGCAHARSKKALKLLSDIFCFYFTKYIY